MGKAVYLDTETTSLVPGQIAQLSYIVEQDSEVTKAVNKYFNVKNMEKGAYETHGLSKELLEELSEGKEFKDFKDELLSDLEGSLFVAHNARFDMKFIQKELDRCGVKFIHREVFDTMLYFKPILKLYNRNGLKPPKLAEVIDYFRIDLGKVLIYAEKIYKEQARGLHDSMTDTTAMFVAVNIARELALEKYNWYNTFKIA